LTKAPTHNEYQWNHFILPAQASKHLISLAAALA
jgi:hypothetical protein